jgi:hypothetical protein
LSIFSISDFVKERGLSLHSRERLLLLTYHTAVVKKHRQGVVKALSKRSASEGTAVQHYRIVSVCFFLFFFKSPILSGHCQPPNRWDLLLNLYLATPCPPEMASTLRNGDQRAGKGAESLKLRGLGSLQ